jgi:hypothetical protein
MADGAFTLTCPCCEASITVDPELRAVIAHEPPPRPRTVRDLSAALGALGSKAAERETRFRQQLEAEARKSRVLDRKFQEGLRKAKDSPDPPRRPFELD